MSNYTYSTGLSKGSIDKRHEIKKEAFDKRH
jgi:hypothetical protein